ncbi:MAG: hypothetical protein JNL58_29485 [Planctomyces sp.]|nr:hypothetical protein [Planctomyces sp.]
MERVVKDIVEYLPEDAVAYLRIAEGDTRFPIRPVPEGDFLIGSGPDCDLRLGDGLLPPLHSILRVSDTSASCALMVRRPELIVNGDPVRKADLFDGDLLEIGPYRFVFRFVSEQSRITSDTLAVTGHPIGEPATAARSMSAADLVRELEQEMEQISVLNRSSQHGVAELMAALDTLSGAVQNLDSSATRPQFDEAGPSTHELMTVFQAQADRIEALSDVLEHVVRQQQIMTQVLHGLTERLNELTARPSRRASA